MKSPTTDKDMKIVKKCIPLTINGINYNVDQLSYLCEDTNDLYQDDALSEYNHSEIMRIGNIKPEVITSLINHFFFWKHYAHEVYEKYVLELIGKGIPIGYIDEMLNSLYSIVADEYQ